MREASVVIPGESRPRVALSDEAVMLLRRLRDRHGALMFHQSGGCCDGSSPMCYPAGEFLTSGADVLLGRFDLTEEGEPAEAAGEIDFWMSVEQFAYWSHTRLLIDVVPGRGSGFSVEAPEGVRFLIRSELMNDVEPFA